MIVCEDCGNSVRATGDEDARMLWNAKVRVALRKRAAEARWRKALHVPPEAQR